MLLLTLIIFSVVSVSFKEKTLILDEVGLSEFNDNSSGLFAIMVQNSNGEYEEYSGESFPTDLVFNSKKSNCINNKGETLTDVLSFNPITDTAIVDVGETMFCYLYFDISTTLTDAILLAENDSSTVSEAISYIESKGEPDFSTTASTDEGLYAAEDDYGTSYYFRGSVEDNYVYFAGFYWRIVRINGDGSVRLIYDGTEAHENGESSTDRQIGTSEYYTNYYTTYGLSVNSNSDVGYMHGDNSYEENHTTTVYNFTSISTSYYFSTSYSFDSDKGLYSLSNASQGYSSFSGLSGYYTCLTHGLNCTTLYYVYNVSSSTSASAYTYTVETTNTYDEEHENKNDSTIKTVVDDWYVSNIYNISDGNGNAYSDYISDTLFCNDRSLASTNTGTGTGRSNTKYASFDRISVSVASDWALTFSNSPILTCPQLNDSFTVDDTKYGNGALTNPVGLLTADEVIMAGGLYTFYGEYYKSYTTSSGYTFPDLTSYYLYTGNSFFTMTPYSGGSIPFVNFVYTSYGLYGYSTYTIGSWGVRPVINLSSSVVITGGDGTIDSPYTVALS